MFLAEKSMRSEVLPKPVSDTPHLCLSILLGITPLSFLHQGGQQPHMVWGWDIYSTSRLVSSPELESAHPHLPTFFVFRMALAKGFVIQVDTTPEEFAVMDDNTPHRV